MPVTEDMPPGRRLISTGSPFERRFGYSRAVVDGDFCFLAGTTGYDYATMTLPPDAADQARNIWRTVQAVLRDAGFQLPDIVRTQIFVTDRAFAEPVLEVCGGVLADIRPASSIYVVTGLLNADMKVEIEVTAKRRAADA
jgi:enamine deaminase RidA (YjgF/YER057c/UK114 family)